MGRFIKPAEIIKEYGLSREFFYRKIVGSGLLKRRAVAGSRFGFYWDEDVRKVMEGGRETVRHRRIRQRRRNLKLEIRRRKERGGRR